MICSNCRRIFLSRIHSSRKSSSSFRYGSTVPANPNAAPIQAPSSISIDSANPAQSSETQTPSASTATLKARSNATKELKKPAKLKSSVPGGVELKGLGYTKAQPRILAKEDDEYPDWLWTLLDAKRTTLGDSKVDLEAMTKKQRAKYERKQAKIRESLPVTVPLHEQSKDLTGPGDDAVTSLERRQEITRSARAARRRSIRESNFLKSM
ncbi:uncharacterized protein Z518_08963 [Rhinocladiella mackenziei CBS 650.93]|uniref:Large ribosomal subunit protein mL54 n=1 Tax=Rhinocladiella mackenziei CBS 650.93 TaxID=1442369 RepID=A0A0D2GSC1_9EURO|nr:uncharacterized protein Z518_08963 [Rhinocladiella mackenziei CBS 650.93]KIX01238.1 hypothetical protein Z518_08963 [Rhinocladiella mackenziei CBS 650.93]